MRFFFPSFFLMFLLIAWLAQAQKKVDLPEENYPDLSLEFPLVSPAPNKIHQDPLLDHLVPQESDPELSPNPKKSNLVRLLSTIDCATECSSYVRPVIQVSG
eukprot:CAMPEP_0172371286 /NCGR_PEP_ID=MMETSP1060-20121228/42017_1 /TAXON_ID=37318 /ORGANISM="Pseudo-nitzschia pungens, Strain cf. cingulata" /LENGTH=101 /DNA_ID=CAMNT_0013096857 /DNA_START=88 /DNA_END=389 /DNA_ORIENTATION=-